MSTARSVAGLIGWLALVFAVAWLGSRFSPGEWYTQLRKPDINPPDWLFAPIWAILYALMAIAAWLVWKKAGFADAAASLTVFLVQLGLNGLWSWLFFGLQSPGLAFADIIVLWIAIFITLLSFWSKNTVAGALLVPYLGWVSYATLLNFLIWQMNP